ncbi:Pseudaminic acid synthase [Novipirellula aureliae]|uniref:Pseudaminic acid synthase n=1 Tax=Novipirellula aureliae TaxID=2527966 RepID=A0A5C6DRN0_9BACT|nr:pseudaminic acid synthase [Novipirellula aureliae]TWU37666.1 Pseudaminic acid synthase [Novipirellula aureliae]
MTSDCVKHWFQGTRTYLIAELSANHGGSLDHAMESIRAMKDSGADAVKLQTYTADTLTIDCDRDDFKVGTGSLWEGRTLYDLYQEAHTPWEWHEPLFQLANDLGMDCFSTPFDKTSVDFLETLNPPAYKIASFELVDLPLIEYVASKGRPVIMSTGMGSLAEIHDAVEIVKKAGVPLALLKCTSAYPALPESMNLQTIPHLADAFGVPAGLSDHTLGIAVPVAAVALGACIIEKHFTLSREAPGPDSAFSLEPHEFKAMVDAVRVTEQALGTVNYELTEKEQASKVFRRSLYVVKDIAKGDMFTEKNVRSIRPGYGLPPKRLSEVVGRTARQDIAAGTALQLELLS